MNKGSIIERPRKDGTITYQAMVKIPGAKAAVRSFSDPEQARAFIEQVQASRVRAAKEWKERWLKPVSPGEQADRNQELWANEWLKTTLKLYFESERITKRSKSSILTIFKYGGDVKLGELNRKWVRDYIKVVRKRTTRSKTPYKWATIADHLKIVSAAMNWRAEEMDAKGAKLPFSVKMLPSGWETKRDRRLGEDEERRLVAGFRARQNKKTYPHTGKHMLRVFRLAIHTAARLQEIVLAEWSEFDLERKYWTIPAAHTKGNKARLVPLNKAALRALKAMKLAQSPDSQRVFHGLSGPKMVSTLFWVLTNKLGIEGLRFHDLRHEAISRLVLKQRQLSVFEIMDIVGHSSIDMLKRYTNLRGDELAAKMID